MNESLGKVIVGLVTDINDDAFYIQKSGVTYQLPRTETMNVQLGDSVEGFAYVGINKELRLTMEVPKVRVGHFSWGTVVDVRRDLGVFVDIGLPDKELVVSMDDLPNEKHLWPKKGDQLMVSIRVDEKDRMWGHLAEETIFQSISKKGTETLNNQNMNGIAYRLKLAGTYILTDDHYLGFIHPSERKDEPRLGERVSGRVIGIRPDGILNISLMPRAHEAISDDAAMLLAILQRTKTGSLPYTDKSSPEEINERFGISKGQFKRALGNLMKQRKIVQENGEIRLVEFLNESH